MYKNIIKELRNKLVFVRKVICYLESIRRPLDPHSAVEISLKDAYIKQNNILLGIEECLEQIKNNNKFLNILSS